MQRPFAGECEDNRVIRNLLLKKLICMKKILLLTLLTASLFSQSYQTKKDSIISNSRKLRYEIKLTYPQIDRPSTNSQRGFNKFVVSMMDAQADTFKVWMKDWEIPKDLDGSSYYETEYGEIYKTDKAISILFYEYSYSLGAAHPNNNNFSVNYDLVNNKVITLGDLFTGNYVRAISEICIKELVAKKKEYNPSINENDEWLQTGAGPKENNFEVFNFTDKELTITFPTYQVGAYVEGPSEVVIPLESLKNNIGKDGVLGR